MSGSSSPHRRLEAVASLVPPGSRVADVGSGHGRLARLLLASRRATHCIATERTPALASRVRPFPPEHPLGHGLELRHGDGLAVLAASDRLDVVILAGLGARSIVRILERGRPERLGGPRLVLQPQDEVARVRRFVLESGLAIVDERLALERRRLYPILAAQPGRSAPLAGHPSLSAEDVVEAGPCLLGAGDEQLVHLWARELRLQESILACASPGPARERAVLRRDLARRILGAL